MSRPVLFISSLLGQKRNEPIVGKLILSFRISPRRCGSPDPQRTLLRIFNPRGSQTRYYLLVDPEIHRNKQKFLKRYGVNNRCTLQNARNTPRKLSFLS